LALDHLAPDNCVIPQLGDWFKQHHQQSKWHFNAEQNIFYHHSNGTWEQHPAINRARLCFSNHSTDCARPARATHVVETKTRTRCVETTGKCNITRRPTLDLPPLVPYTSNIGLCIKALPWHIQILVGDIPTLRTPTGWDPTIPVNIIIATDGSVTLGVGYHSWIVATEEEDIILQGGGPDDGDLFLIQSYQSELGGVASGLAFLGTLSRSGLINIASTTFLCNNESAILSANRPLTDSIFHRIERDNDLVSTIKHLQENWCRGLHIRYKWVKGHADDLNRELTRAERLNVIADEQCDVVRQQASGPQSARSSAGLWDSETCALFLRGSNITSRMKERLTQQLLDADLRDYLEKKELWSAQKCESIDWTNYRSAFKRLSKGRQTAVAKATHNLWHTRTWHQQYFGEAKACCMCNCETEDWRRVLACGLIDASLHRAVSWGKLRKLMERWHLPQDFWTTIEKGVNHYTE
jgi:hypothetical protein